MAGRGPAPKDPNRRARGNRDPVPATLLRFEPAHQPSLPGGASKWPERTRDWWNVWGSSPQSEHFTATDWEFLLETALLHAKFWAGDMSVASELRLRVAKMGATPEDRARLRMMFADADEKDSKRPPVQESARQRYGDLRVLPGVNRTDGAAENA